VEFTPQYAGTWLLHCHVVSHVIDQVKYPRGMLSLLHVPADESVASSQPSIQIEVDAGGAGLSQETHAASIQNFKPHNYPSAVADRRYDVYNTNCRLVMAIAQKANMGQHWRRILRCMMAPIFRIPFGRDAET